MELRITIANPNAADISKALDMIAGKEVCSVVLSKSEMTYIQTDGVGLEHQEGSLDSHYFCPYSLNFVDVPEMLQSYADGNDLWRTLIMWEKGFC